MTAVVAGRAPKRRVALLVLVAVVVSALAASATAVALSSRADLSSTRRRVDDTWTRLRPALDARYRNLADGGGVARNRLGAGRAVFDDIDKAAWRLARHGPGGHRAAGRGRGRPRRPGRPL